MRNIIIKAQEEKWVAFFMARWRQNSAAYFS